MSKNRFIAIRNQASDSTLELFFLDVIQDTFDWYMGWTSQVQQVIDKVNAYKPSKIKVIIDSEGGDAQTGMSIYNFLKRCDAKVEVEIIGLAASIASVIAMAANKGKLKIARNAFIMIHKAEGGVWGTSDELRKGAEIVDMYTNQIVDIYSQRTGKSVDEINKLIAEGDFWMTGEEAVAQGFADETFNDTPNLQIAARLDPQQYKNIPAQIRAQMKPNADPQDQNSFIKNQFEDMKKFFTGIVDAIRGIKPSDKPEDQGNITNQIADAVQAPFEKLGDEIEATITNKVNEVVAGDSVNKALGVQVENAVKAIDFSVGGPAKTAVENLVKVAVENATKTYNEQIAALEKAKTDLEAEIVNIKGKPVNTGNGSEGGEGKVRGGKFS